MKIVNEKNIKSIIKMKEKHYNQLSKKLYEKIIEKENFLYILTMLNFSYHDSVKLFYNKRSNKKVTIEELMEALGKLRYYENKCRNKK